MHNSKLFDVLTTFDQNWMNHFNLYLNYYRAKQDNATIRLFDYIYAIYPNLQSTKLTKEAVHTALFLDKKFDEKRVLNSMSDLLSLTEEFIAFYTSRNNKVNNSFHLLQYYLEHDLNKQFESLYKELHETIEQTPEDMTTLIFSYQLEMLNVSYQLKYDKRSSNYQNSYNALNNLMRSQEKKLDNLFLVNLYTDIDKNIIDSKIAEIHLALNELLIHEDASIEDYTASKNKLLKHAHTIAKEELLTAVVIVVNYCIDKINKKQSHFNQELIFWYDYMIENDCILDVNGTISSAIVKNYITISIRLNDIQKAELFLEKYANFLEEREKEDVYNYNKANLLFYKNKYEVALVLLTSVKYKDIFYKLSAKRLNIKIYFALVTQQEKAYIDVLESALNAFKKYIYTTKEITESVRTRNKSFYKYAARLANLHKNEKVKLQQLQEDITQDTECADSEWLLDNINNLL